MEFILFNANAFSDRVMHAHMWVVENMAGDLMIIFFEYQISNSFA